MSIPENQLSVWSNQGATKTSQLTYKSIKTCIDNINWNEDINYKIYLQGSYKNYTNIRANSDIDVVIEFRSIFNSNFNDLDDSEIDDFNSCYEAGKYSLADFKEEIIKELIEYYGKKNIKIDDKAIKIKGFNGRLDADVVVCNLYRKYNSFSKENINDYYEGIFFINNGTGEVIINYPNLHYSNGAKKNAKTNNNYKPTVRIIKNIKSKLIEKGYITKKECPSYFIENLVYNVPNIKFRETNFHTIIYNVLNYWLNSIKNDKLGNFICQNEMIELFGNSDQQWSKKNAIKFITEIIDYWNKFKQ